MDIKDILDEISLPARSNKRGFKDTSKLEKIEEILERENSPFHLIKKSDHAWIFGKKNISYGKEVLLVSSHADIVPEIKKPFSELDEEKKYFKGTYDNMGTNAACTEIMLNREMPDNVYFAFTAEEETGRFTGAEYALAYVRNKSGNYPKVIVLDVTYEGYDHDRLCTIEGLHAPTEKERKGLLEKMMELEGNEQSFEVVRMKKKDDNSFLPKEYRAKSTTDCDESFYYAKQDCLSFSLDLPTDGSMHSDSGLRTKEAVMRGYIDCLTQTCYMMTNTYPDKIDDLKTSKDAYVLGAIDTDFYKTKTSSYFNSYYNAYNSSYTPYRPVFSKKNDDDYPGQMSISDYIDTEDNEKSIDEMRDEDPDFEMWYEEFLTSAYEIATAYDKDDIGLFIEDMAALGELEYMPEELEERLIEIWNEAWIDFESSGFAYEDE